MNESGNIKNYSAADIEKNRKGELSPREMHEMENAALDDPFLADALEGYYSVSTNISADMAELNQRLAARTEKGKLVAMNQAGSKKYLWLRVAAMLLLLIGAGLLAKQFLFNKHENRIAALSKQTSIPVSNDSSVASSTIATDSNAQKGETKTSEGTLSFHEAQSNGRGETKDKKKITTEFKPTTTLKDNSTVLNFSPTTKENPAPVTVTGNSQDTKTERPADEETVRMKAKQQPGNNVMTRSVTVNRKDTNGDGVEDKSDTDSAKMNAAGLAKSNKNNSNAAGLVYRANIFRGRITDGQNRGLPFANVTNTQDNNAGTYTDVNGYFNLTYPDTLLNVHVKSVGFETNDVQLKSTLANNHVVMNDDRSIDQIVLSNNRPNTDARRQQNSIKIEEPEPADGWDNYDTYLVNNVEEPLEIKEKQIPAGKVEVSFDVNKRGEPVNIKVDKSLCDNCDKEAVRLVKEGPKWKRNRSNKKKATVIVDFNSSN